MNRRGFFKALAGAAVGTPVVAACRAEQEPLFEVAVEERMQVEGYVERECYVSISPATVANAEKALETFTRRMSAGGFTTISVSTRRANNGSYIVYMGLSRQLYRPQTWPRVPKWMLPKPNDVARDCTRLRFVAGQQKTC